MCSKLLKQIQFTFTDRTQINLLDKTQAPKVFTHLTLKKVMLLNESTKYLSSNVRVELNKLGHKGHCEMPHTTE